MQKFNSVHVSASLLGLLAAEEGRAIAGVGAQEGERKLSAIMFTDIVGYTKLTQENERLALTVLEEHRNILRPIFKIHSGKEIDTIGDAFLVEFASVLEAARCAQEIQSVLNNPAFSSSMWSSEQRQLKIRIGIHLGDVVRKGENIYGDAVNIASRIEPFAEPGGICITQQVYDQIRNYNSEFTFQRLGERELKNVALPYDIYRILVSPNIVTESEQKLLEKSHGMMTFDKKRIAILPFANISPDPKDGYFADGLTEELISTMSKISGLKVISRTSVMLYKDQKKNISNIANELNVGTILEGSVRKAGEKVRITAQLIDSQNSDHLWSESYNRELKDIFAIQSEISESVAQELRVTLLKLEKERIEKVPTLNLEAYTSYMKGLFEFGKFAKDSMVEAIRCFEDAAMRDRGSALAYSGLSQCYWWLAFFGTLSSSESSPKARYYAEKALKIDNSLAEAHLSLALVLSDYDWDSVAADQEIRLALKLNPSLARAHVFASHILVNIGKFEEAIAEARTAIELDPVSALNLSIAATELMSAGLYEEAIPYLSKALKIDKNIPLTHNNLGLAHILKGMYDVGIPLIEEALKMSGENDPGLFADLAYAYVKAGQVDRARQIKFRLLDLRSEGRCHAVTIAAVCSSLGQIDEAYDWLEKAVQERNPYLRAIKVDFALENVRSDLRFPLLLKKIGLEQT